MTVKELKEKIAAIPEEFDNMKILTDDPDYDEYCMGDSYEEVIGITCYDTKRRCFGSAFGDDCYYISFDL